MTTAAITYPNYLPHDCRVDAQDKLSQKFILELSRDFAHCTHVLKGCLARAAHDLHRMDDGSKVLQDMNRKMLAYILRMRARFLALHKALMKKDHKKVGELALEAAHDPGFSFNGSFTIPAYI